MKFQFTGCGYLEPKAYHIEYFYNRHTRDWVVQVYDDNDVEHYSEYCPDKGWRDSTIESLKKEYFTDNVIKK